MVNTSAAGGYELTEAEKMKYNIRLLINQFSFDFQNHKIAKGSINKCVTDQIKNHSIVQSSFILFCLLSSTNNKENN